MKYAVFNDAGVLLTRLIKGVNEIPESAIEVDDDLWMRLTQEVDGEWRIDAEGVIYKADLPPPSVESLIVAANARRDVLLTEASLRMAPLQDALDLDEATEAEAALLKDWKRYRVALNRLPDQAGYPAEIDWPAPPA